MRIPQQSLRKINLFKYVSPVRAQSRVAKSSVSCNVSQRREINIGTVVRQTALRSSMSQAECEAAPVSSGENVPFNLSFPYNLTKTCVDSVSVACCPIAPCYAMWRSALQSM